MRKGDRLIGGETVLAIEGEGVRLDRDGAPVLIAFEETRETMFNRIVDNGTVETEDRTAGQRFCRARHAPGPGTCGQYPDDRAQWWAR